MISFLGLLEKKSTASYVFDTSIAPFVACSHQMELANLGKDYVACDVGIVAISSSLMSITIQTMHLRRLR